MKREICYKALSLFIVKKLKWSTDREVIISHYDVVVY